MSNKLVSSWIYVFIAVSLFYLVKYFYLKPEIKVAQDCPPIETNLADGKPFKLDQLKGKYVLLDFWGSWCGPCRKEAPLLRKFYHQWNQTSFQTGQGLEVLSIAIESNRNAWAGAVAQDEMTWPYHILELDQFNSPLVKSFGVKEIPTKILIDPAHHIVAINQSFEEMNELLTRKKL
ncbi:MAG: TlpA disulfide reductase family protein [Saprospiraceae bacterium]